jgi:hypothetical protein
MVQREFTGPADLRGILNRSLSPEFACRRVRNCGARHFTRNGCNLLENPGTSLRPRADEAIDHEAQLVRAHKKIK